MCVKSCIWMQIDETGLTVEMQSFIYTFIYVLYCEGKFQLVHSSTACLFKKKMYNNPGQHGYHKASTIAFGCLLQSTDPKDSPLYTLSLLIYTGKACVSPWVVCVINSMGALEKGSPAKHVGSCQTVHALGRGWVCVAVCECGLSKG